MSIETPKTQTPEDEEMLNKELEALDKQKQKEINSYINGIKEKLGTIQDNTDETVKRLGNKIMELRKNIDELPNLDEKQKNSLYKQLDNIGFGPKYELSDTEAELKKFEDYLKLVKNGTEKVEETKREESKPKAPIKMEQHENMKYPYPPHIG